MIKRASLIIIAISFFCGRVFATQSFELLLRVHNDSAAVQPAGEVCGLMPLTQDAKARSWQVSSAVPLRQTTELYCLKHGELGPYQSQRIALQWLSAKSSDDPVWKPTAPYDLTDSPSLQLLQLSDSFKAYPQPERVKQIHTWMVANIAFSGIRRGVEGAEYALRVGNGDCTEHMLLAGELLQRNGVTIRRVLGVSIPKDQHRVSAASLHNWIEYLDNGSWLVFDSSKNVLGVTHAESYLSLLFYQHSQQLFDEPFTTDLPRLKLFLQ